MHTHPLYALQVRCSSQVGREISVYTFAQRLCPTIYTSIDRQSSVVPRYCKRVTDVSRTDNHFPGQTFPGQFVYIILNTLECSCSKINDELSCAPCTYDYMLLIIILVCIIIFLS